MRIVRLLLPMGAVAVGDCWVGGVGAERNVELEHCWRWWLWVVSGDS